MNFKNRLLLITIFILFVRCSTPQGFNGVSNDIADSKERKVYMGEYFSNTNPIVINDSTRLYLKEVWVEQTWKHGATNNSTYPQEGFQLCINSSEECLKKYDDDWTIENSFTKSLRFCNKNSLVGEMDSSDVNRDTINYKIVKGSPLLSDSLIVIGKLTLVRKNKKHLELM